NPNAPKNPKTVNPDKTPNKNKPNPQPKNQFGPQSKNLASIIRGFKSSVTTDTRKNHADFDWQPGYYDHIIRNHKEYCRIRNYIINNPKNWDEDRFNG
ncbi:MAG: hypothetical protein K9I29_01465, partial [Bacteroidales bacterium]|nr:hypothetical protein [Bacteroidales bacterium]